MHRFTAARNCKNVFFNALFPLLLADLWGNFPCSRFECWHTHDVWGRAKLLCSVPLKNALVSVGERGNENRKRVSNYIIRRVGNQHSFISVPMETKCHTV